MSNTVLRQNQNNVYEWLNRISLCQDDPYLAIKTYTEAIQTIDPSQAFGKTSKVWISFAHFYEKNDSDLENSNHIFHKASQLPFKTIDELANIYCSWAEMHIRHKNYKAALDIMKHACTSNRPQRKRRGQKDKAVKDAAVEQKEEEKQELASLYSNFKAWSLYIDLLENFGTVENTKSAY